jgi:hypothetical protein
MAPVQSAPTVEADKDLVAKFVAMGFEKENVIQALQSTTNGIEETMERLLEFVYDEDIPDDQSDSYDQTSVSFEDNELLRQGVPVDMDERNFADDLAEVLARSEEEAKENARRDLAQDIALKEALRRSLEAEANGISRNGVAKHTVQPQVQTSRNDEQQDEALQEALRRSIKEEYPSGNGAAFHVEPNEQPYIVQDESPKAKPGGDVVHASDELVAQLVGMDFPVEAATRALQSTRNNLDAALEMLLVGLA